MIALILAASLALAPGKPAGVRQAMHERVTAPVYIGTLAAGGTAIWLVMGKGNSAPSTTGSAP